MFEGPSYYGEDQDTLPEPTEEFDVVAEAERLKNEREEREKQEKEARDIAHKEQLAKKLSAKKETETPEEKKRWFEIPDRPAESDVKEEEKPVEMNFTSGSEYTDDTLDNGNEAVFDLNEKPSAPESSDSKTEDITDHIKAQAEALNKAREALYEVAVEKPEPTTIAATERAVNELSQEEDEIRKRINESWIQPAAKEELAKAEPLIVPEIPEVKHHKTDESISGEVPEVPEIIVHDDGSELPSSVEPVEAEIVEVSDPQTSRSELYESVEGLHDVAEILPEPENIPVSTNHEVTAKDEQYESEITPEWVRTVKNEVRSGRAPELRKWQKDILGVQYPELLAEYQSILRESYPARFEAPGENAPQLIANHHDYMPEYMRASHYSQLPQPLDQGGEGSYAPYAGNPVTNSWDRIKSSLFSFLDYMPASSLAAIMVGGGILGAILIIAFGF